MLIQCYYQENKDNKYIKLLEDFCDNNSIELMLYEAKDIKTTPLVIMKDDLGMEVATISGNITRSKLKDIYNDALY